MPTGLLVEESGRRCLVDSNKSKVQKAGQSEITRPRRAIPFPVHKLWPSSPDFLHWGKAEPAVGFARQFDMRGANPVSAA